MTGESFTGLMGESGFQPDSPERWRAVKRQWWGKRCVVRIEGEDEVRSVFQNRRHFVQCTAVAELWSVNGRVVSPTQAHYILARAFVGVEMTPMGEVPLATRTLTKAQFNAFMDQIDAHFAQEGTPLPTMEAC